MRCQKLGGGISHFCLPGGGKTVLFFALGHVLRLGVCLVQNCLDDQLYPGSSGVQAHFSAVFQSSYDFDILAVRSAGGEVHVLDKLGVDELGVGVYALAPEFNP